MKKTFRSIFAFAAAAIAFTSCVQNEVLVPEQSQEVTVNFQAFSPETKTSFTAPDGASYPVVWNEGDQVKISLNLASAANSSAEASVTPSADGKSAKFVAKISKDTTVNKFYVLSPASAFLSVSSLYKSWGITVPVTQTPSALSVDPAAQILVAESATTATMPESVDLTFAHWTAYAKMSLTNLALGDAAVKSVSVTAEDPIAGRWNYYCEDTDSNTKGQSAVNSGANTITINTTAVSNIWFALAPVDLSGKTLKVTVSTDKGSFSKTVTLGAGKKFESGKIAKFNVDMAGVALEAPKVYTRIKDASELLADSKIIIAAFADTSAVAISTTQNGNNIAETAVTKSGNTITDPSESVEVFTVEAGTVSGSYAFKTASTGKYIYAAGGTKNNYLKATDTKSAAASFTVAVDASEYAVIKCADEAVTRNSLRYNWGSKVFSCYAETSSIRDSVAIYKLNGSGSGAVVTKKDPKLATEISSANIKVGESIEIEATTESDATIKYATSDATVAIVNDENMIEGLKAGSCTVTVSVKETATYAGASISIPVTVKSADATAKTVSEILAACAGSLNVATSNEDLGSFETGNVTIVAVNGSNAIIKDATGVMLLFKSSPGAVGDVIKVEGKVVNYYGVAEFSQPAVTKVSEGATIDHGTPSEITDAVVAAFEKSPVVMYGHARGSVSADGKDLNVGTRIVRLYNALADQAGKTVDVYGYTIGISKAKNINFINTSYEVVTSGPSLSVDNTSKVWAYDETDAFVVNVSVANGSWSVTPATLSWANVTVNTSANTITVAPKGNNTSGAAYEAELVVSHSADASLKSTITLRQNTKPAEGTATYVLDGEAITKAHSSAWSYTSGNKTILASDGSSWTCFNTYGSTSQVTVQMNKAKGCYVLTPAVPAGKKINKLTVTCATSGTGTPTTGVTRTFDVTDATTGDAILTDIKGDDLTAGQTVEGTHTQLKIAPNETNGGACYIVNITVEYN